jgi:ribulose-bisphosphate carboxylase large chain
MDRVTELVEFYGPDVMLLIGGALLAPADRLAERTRIFVAAMEAAHADSNAARRAALS